MRKLHFELMLIVCWAGLGFCMCAMSGCLILIQNDLFWRILVVICCSALANIVVLAAEHLFVADVDPLESGPGVAAQRSPRSCCRRFRRRSSWPITASAFVLSAALEMGMATYADPLDVPR